MNNIPIPVPLVHAHVRTYSTVYTARAVSCCYRFLSFKVDLVEPFLQTVLLTIELKCPRKVVSEKEGG